ncbi:uncharacterized protein LOC116618341 [Nematostella vectensis]|uniref:uncharacterized protein LOC116618341 n=1 Tax=Nematostella vectensis TaxID=45351 RepID=UPI0013905EF5|nr:uncharacterized protein LOC116618341 [Nematostella vectensis]
MHRRTGSSRKEYGDKVAMYGISAKNREYLASMANDMRFSEPIDQGSNLHMALKLLKAENSNLEKIIIILKTENQTLQRKMKELEYQNDRFKVTQNQLKTELKREKDMVKYLHGLAKKHERTIQKKDAESRLLRREVREAETKPSDEPPPLPERTDRLERIAREKTLTLDNLDSIDARDRAKEKERIPLTPATPSTPSTPSPTSETPRPRPQPPKRSDSFNIKRNRPFIIPRGDNSRASSYNSDSAVSGITIRAVNTEASTISKHKVSLTKPATEARGPHSATDNDSTEWDGDMNDVLGFLNEKVNQFERLLVETGGSSNSGSEYSSSDTIGPGK